MTIPPPNTETHTNKNGKINSPAHRKFVRSRLCLMWERKDCEGPVDCAHFRDIAPRGHGGGKPSDLWVGPMCRKHHAASEKREAAFGRDNGIDFVVACMELAAASPDRRIKQAAMEYMKAEKAKRVTA